MSSLSIEQLKKATLNSNEVLFKYIKKIGFREYCEAQSVLQPFLRRNTLYLLNNCNERFDCGYFGMSVHEETRWTLLYSPLQCTTFPYENFCLIIELLVGFLHRSDLINIMRCNKNICNNLKERNIMKLATGFKIMTSYHKCEFCHAARVEKFRNSCIDCGDKYFGCVVSSYAIFDDIFSCNSIDNKIIPDYYVKHLRLRINKDKYWQLAEDTMKYYRDEYKKICIYGDNCASCDVLHLVECNHFVY